MLILGVTPHMDLPGQCARCRPHHEACISTSVQSPVLSYPEEVATPCSLGMMLERLDDMIMFTANIILVSVYVRGVRRANVTIF